jgi:hypothetical protein
VTWPRSQLEGEERRFETFLKSWQAGDDSEAVARWQARTADGKRSGQDEVEDRDGLHQAGGNAKWPGPSGATSSATASPSRTTDDKRAMRFERC